MRTVQVKQEFCRYLADQGTVVQCQPWLCNRWPYRGRGSEGGGCLSEDEGADCRRFARRLGMAPGPRRRRQGCRAHGNGPANQGWGRRRGVMAARLGPRAESQVPRTQAWAEMRTQTKATTNKENDTDTWTHGHTEPWKCQSRTAHDIKAKKTKGPAEPREC